MSIFNYTEHTQLPITIDKAWSFFSSPLNLGKITPPHMNFIITSGNGHVKTYQGQIITYKVSPLLGIQLNWCTEIAHVNEPHYFVDVQRKGPYKMWHHQHHFSPIANGVSMTDLLHYELPLGFLGNVMNHLFIKKEIEKIFSYRKQALIEIFGKYSG